MARRCPNCGAVVPKGSLTCPQCYAEVPRGSDYDGRDREGYCEAETKEGYRRQIGARRKSLGMTMALATIPAFFGLLGLGQIYQDWRDGEGWFFLGIGLILFWLAVGLFFLVGGSLLERILYAVPAVIAAIAYVSASASSIAKAFFGSFRIFGLGFRSVPAAPVQVDG